MPLSVHDLDPHVWTEAVARDYDRSSESMYRPEVLDPTVDFLADQARGGPVAEFAIGTGRVALPLAARGVEVHGIEFSQPMVDELRRKPGGDRIPVAVGDMASTRLPGEFSLVFLAYNAITCLLTQDEQAACVWNAGAHLRDGGALVIEVSVPPLLNLMPGERFKPFQVTADHLGIDELDVVQQLLVSHHYDFFDGRATTFSSPHRWVWPSELDLMAASAGLVPDGRWADWSQAPFTADNESHVSVWRKVAGTS